jgi:hypothetical protein
MVVQALDANTGVVALASMLTTALSTATNDVSAQCSAMRSRASARAPEPDQRIVCSSTASD